MVANRHDCVGRLCIVENGKNRLQNDTAYLNLFLPIARQRGLFWGLRLARARLHMDMTVLALGKVVIQSTNDTPRTNVEGLGNPQQRPKIDRVTSFDLLPVSQAETERNHIFLSVPLLLS